MRPGDSDIPADPDSSWLHPSPIKDWGARSHAARAHCVHLALSEDPDVLHAARKQLSSESRPSL